MAKRGDLDKPATKGDLFEFRDDFDKKILQLSDNFDKKLGQMSSNFDTKLLQVTAKLDGNWTKRFNHFEEKFDRFRDDILTVLDGHTVILKRLDQERLFTLERIKRIEHDIELIKKHVGFTA